MRIAQSCDGRRCARKEECLGKGPSDQETIKRALKVLRAIAPVMKLLTPAPPPIRVELPVKKKKGKASGKVVLEKFPDVE